MAEDVDRRLEINCDENETKKVTMKEDQLKVERERKLLEDDFKTHVNEIFQPVMEEYEDNFQSRARHRDVQEEEYEREFLIDNRYKEPYIVRKLRARAQSDYYRYPNYVPHMRFILDPFRKDVGIYTEKGLSGRGGVGPIEYYELEKITKSFMSNRIVKWIKKNFFSKE